MAFVVEDGTGLETATVYVDEAFADDYFLTHGNIAWAGLTSGEKQRLITLGSDFADTKWGVRLKGRPLLDTQALAFPRSGLRDRYGRLIEGVPKEWKKAVCEYSIAAYAGELYKQAQPQQLDNVKKKKTVVGPITTELEYRDTPMNGTFATNYKADAMVRQFIVTSSGVVH